MFNFMLCRSSARVDSNSPSRNRPLSTKIHVCRSPTALCTERSRNGRVNSTRQSRDDSSVVTKLSANAFDLFLDHCLRRPITATTANRKKKIAQHLRAQWRVRNFGMKLHAIDAARFIFHRVQSIVGERSHLKTGRHFSDVIAMTHPNVHLFGQTLKQTARHIENFQSRVTKLAIRRSSHIAAKLACKNLKPVTDAERGTID